MQFEMKKKLMMIPLAHMKKKKNLLINSFKRIVALMFSLLVLDSTSIPANADDLSLRTGDYVRDGGNGQLSLKSAKRNEFTFFIHTDGANGHLCELNGTIRNGNASLTGDEGNLCTVSFRNQPDGIEVVANNACNYYCGARASIQGTYLLTARSCSPTEVKKKRSQFKRLYNRKDYGNAETSLKPLLSDCARTLNYFDSAWIRNDLAITQYQLGKLTACRNTLEPLVFDALTYIGQDELTVRPDQISLIPVMKATLTNLKLCGDSRVETLKQ